MPFRKQIAFRLVSVMVLLTLAACAQVGDLLPGTAEGMTPTAGTPPLTPGLPPEAVLEAQRWLADQLAVAVEQVQVLEVEQAQWSDSCLGLGGANEICAQVVTPGWRVVFEVAGTSYEVRTDETGAVVRMASPLKTPGEPGALEGVHWSLVSFGPPGAERPIVEGSSITLLLADGNAGGVGGCNSYGAEYQVEGDEISFGRITSTLVACVDERVTEQERSYFEALESASRFEVEDNKLRLSYDDGEGLLVFESALTAP